MWIRWRLLMAHSVVLRLMGAEHTLEVSPTELELSVRDFLIVRRLPPSLFVVRDGDRVVSEDAKLRAGLRFEAIKELDLLDLSRVFGQRTPDETSSATIYTQRWLQFDYKGNRVNYHAKTLDKAGLIDFVESTIDGTINGHGMLPAGEAAAIALSGGKDSVSLTLALERIYSRRGEKLRDHAIAITLEGWGGEQVNTYRYAKEAAKRAGIEHVVLSPAAVAAAFNLKRPFEEVFNEISQDPRLEQDNKTLILAQIQRRLVEVAARDRGIGRLVFGLNLEDIVSEIVLSLSTGHVGLDVPVRPIGRFRYVYPLVYLKKKVVTLYLESIAPELTHQETVQRVERGSQSAHFYIAMAAWLTELWPGVEYQVVAAYHGLSSVYESTRTFRDCSNCGATMVIQKSDPDQGDDCYPCRVFRERGLITAR